MIREKSLQSTNVEVEETTAAIATAVSEKLSKKERNKQGEDKQQRKTR